MTIDRRTTLRWIAAAALVSPVFDAAPASAWPSPALTPAPGPGYGTDPNLLEPTVPWPLLLDEAQMNTVSVLSDLILPAEGAAPSATAAQTPAFINEWVSAPYPDQQRDRALIVAGLVWLDQESAKRGRKPFARASAKVRRAICDEIAYKDRVKPGHEKAAEFFERMRALTLGAYYTRPENWAEIGYVGNTPIMGEYPGPTAEALAHLEQQLAKLNLKLAV